MHSRMTSAHAKRLTQEDWLIAGMAALAEQGPEALKAEPLARRLGTTKGSFYWHFKDVPAFHATLLDLGERKTIADIADLLEDAQTPVGRLRRMGQSIAEKSTSRGAAPGVEAAVRAWAKGNAAALATLSRVDHHRKACLHDLLKDTGIGNPEMARIILAASIGMEELDEDGENIRTMGSLVDLVLALR